LEVENRWTTTFRNVKSLFNPSQLQIKGFGKRKLLYPNERNEKEAQMNRRVELEKY
jgi:flagellar motor protein MotB